MNPQGSGRPGYRFRDHQVLDRDSGQIGNGDLPVIGPAEVRILEQRTKLDGGFALASSWYAGLPAA